jgi:hypothetical protein
MVVHCHAAPGCQSAYYRPSGIDPDYPAGLPRWWEQGSKGKVDGRAARAAYGGDATRAASAWKHRAGDTNRPTRQTPAGGRVRAGLGSCCHLEQGLERQTGKGQGPPLVCQP